LEQKSNYIPHLSPKASDQRSPPNFTELINSCMRICVRLQGALRESAVLHSTRGSCKTAPAPHLNVKQ